MYDIPVDGKRLCVGPERRRQRSSVAIDGQLGGNMIRNAASTDALVPQYRMGSTSNSGLITKLHMEYYLPKAPFSLKVGYEHEELHFLKGDGSCDLNQLMLGGRWYPAPAQWKVCPYVGVDVLYAFGADRGPFEMTSSMSWSVNGLTEKTIPMPSKALPKLRGLVLVPLWEPTSTCSQASPCSWNIATGWASTLLIELITRREAAVARPIIMDRCTATRSPSA